MTRTRIEKESGDKSPHSKGQLAPNLTALAAILLTLGGMASAAEPIAAKGPLAGLPSEEGKHLERIRALPDNAWLELGAPAADAKWGRARGRSWTAKMPRAPKLRGAFLMGQGVHGYVKPDGHYMDDLWFYDINAHRWVCCYPGANTKTLALTINKDGFEADKDGQPIPVAGLGHGYEMAAYDTAKRRFLFMPCGDPYWGKPLAERKNWLKSPPKDASPWMFETAAGKWNRQRTGTPGPPTGFGDVLHYLPESKRAFFAHRSGDVWFFDTEKNRWKQAKPKGPKPPFGIDATSCYDPKRQRICLGGGGYPNAPKGQNAFWIYDLKTNTWIDPQPQGAPVQGSTSYGTNNALMVYDSGNEVVLLVYHSFNYSKKELLGVYVYDPAANNWAAEALPIPKKLGEGRKCKNGFYDPKLNAVFIHSAGDSRDDSVMWCFRYQKRS